VAVRFARRKSERASSAPWENEAGMTGRRAILLVAAMLIALVAIGRVALAETFTGNDRDNRLIGTNQRDSISGGDGDDLMKGLRSIDSLNGGRGNDDIFAGPMDERARDTVGDRGNDFIYVFNSPAAKDVVAG
jgi:hypothetical protein